MKQGFIVTLCMLFCLLAGKARGQEASITLGSKNVALNEAFTITISLTNEDIASHSNFPEIRGFVKAGTSSQSSTVIVNGEMSSTNSIVQTYLPQKEGKFTLKPFSMEINGQNIRVQGETITVTAAREQRSDPFAYDPFEDFFPGQQPRDLDLDTKEDAFFSVNVPQKEVFVGEGFNVSVSFYVSEFNPSNLQFYKLGEQLTEIIKKIKPNNCWEENFGIESIEGVPVTINNKRYTEYKIFQASFFPLNAEPIKIPAASLQMVRYNLLSGGVFGQTQEEIKSFSSKPISIKVKELPPHPLRSAVPVGNYYLDESLSKAKAETGQSVSYDFRIRGEGNLTSIAAPQAQGNSTIEIYPPNTRQNTERRNGRVTGTKIFTYNLLAKEAGTYNLSDYFQIIVFNPSKARYDTLKPQAQLVISGASKQAINLSDVRQDNFYRIINNESNRLQSADREEILRDIANIILLVILLVTMFFIVRKTRN